MPHGAVFFPLSSSVILDKKHWIPDQVGDDEKRQRQGYRFDCSIQ